MKPQAPFRYWGSKARMAPWIIERLPAHDHFIEACAGSGAVMAVKPPVLAETLNDVYDEVVNFWRVLRDPEPYERLVERVAFTPYSQAEFTAAWAYAAMTGPIGPMPDVERAWAWAFIVRMQMAVVPGKTGWSYSVNGRSARQANRPGRWDQMPEVLRATAARIKTVQITQLDVLDLIARFDVPGVLFFVDMPYLNDSRPGSVGPGKTAYVEDDFPHEGFVDAMLATNHASFAITHYPHPFYDLAAAWSSVEDFTSYRNQPNGEGRDAQIERLYILDRSSSPHRRELFPTRSTT